MNISFIYFYSKVLFRYIDVFGLNVQLYFWIEFPGAARCFLGAVSMYNMFMAEDRVYMMIELYQISTRFASELIVKNKFLQKVHLNGVLEISAIYLNFLTVKLSDLGSWPLSSDKDVDDFLSEIFQRLLIFWQLLKSLVLCLSVLIKHLCRDPSIIIIILGAVQRLGSIGIHFIFPVCLSIALVESCSRKDK